MFNLGSVRVVVRKFLPVSLYPVVAHVYKILLQRQVRRIERQDEKYFFENGNPCVPSAYLRFKVIGPCTIETYLNTGKELMETIGNAIESSGKTWGDFSTALDFGCGCGRVIRAFKDDRKGIDIYGTDIDKETVGWAVKNLDYAVCGVNKEFPPLEYGDEKFDLVWSFSIFTHLDEKHQFEWLEEMQRVMKPGGIFIASVHGPHCWNGLPSTTVSEIKEKGFVYAVTKVDEDFFPDWYQTAWHTEKYIKEKWSQYFEVINYIERGCNNYQDVVVLKKR